VDQRVLTRIARLYYEEHATQGEIALELGLSRPKVQRLLRQALDRGIVQIRVVPPLETDTEAERELERAYGLREVIAVEVAADQREAVQELGSAAAHYVRSAVRDDATIGVSWGRSLAAMVAAFEPCPLQGARVVQVLGALPEGPEHEGTGLARRFARNLNALLHLVPAPGLVANAVVRDTLLADDSVARSLELARAANLLVVGIGAIPPRPGTALSTVLGDDEIANLLRLGAVGDIALRFFDEAGAQVETDVDRRVVGLELDAIRTLDVVAIAGGAPKCGAIRGALRGGLVDVLITDAATARSLAADVDR
jgi:DNA-binding transcriptional regulator LsrR (DeoR family)